MSSSDFSLPTPNPSVVFKELDEGAILLSSAEEVYFGINRVGARIWSLLPPAKQTFDEMCAVLAGEYSDVGIDRIRQDARKFLDDIVASGLAVPAANESGEGSVSPAKATKGP
jgi:hypothetical protein